jgi:hypothetical protein
MVAECDVHPLLRLGLAQFLFLVRHLETFIVSDSFDRIVLDFPHGDVILCIESHAVVGFFVDLEGHLVGPFDRPGKLADYISKRA